MTSRATRAPATNRSRHGLSAVRPRVRCSFAPVTAECRHTRWIVSPASDAAHRDSFGRRVLDTSRRNVEQRPRGRVAASSRCVRTARDPRPHDRVRPEGGAEGLTAYSSRRRGSANSSSGTPDADDRLAGWPVVAATAVKLRRARALLGDCSALDAPSPLLGLANETNRPRRSRERVAPAFLRKETRTDAAPVTGPMSLGAAITTR